MKTRNSRVFSHLVVAALFCASLGSARGAAPVYTTDFESGAGSEWSITTTDNSIPATFSRFSGRFNNHSQVLSLTGLTPGVSHTLVFDLYVFDSWDGGSVPSGDLFRVLADATTLLEDTISQFGGTQSWTAVADSKGQFGFGGWEDSIFRTVTRTFTPAAATATITFQGANLQAVDDESWGIDNVAVWRSAELPPTSVASSSLPAEGSTGAVAIDRFSISALRPLLPTSATNAANYELRHAGANGNFGDSDDTVYTLSASYTPNTKVVNFTTSPNPLQPGKWRFQTLAGLLDQSSSGITPFTRIFTLANPTLGNLENADNGSLPLATPLTMTETPAGSTFFTGYGIGTFATVGEVDYWRFDAEAGDRITVDLEATDRVGVYPQVQLRNAADTYLTGAGGGYSDGNARFQNYVIGSPGTYYLRVWTDNAISTYRVRVDQSRGIPLESESNDSQGSATSLNLTLGGGVLSGRAAGALDSGDSAGDYYRLGQLNVGTAVNVSVALPDGSALAAGDVGISIEHAGGSGADASGTGTSFNHVATADAVHFVRISSAKLDLRSQYIATVTITDGVPPTVASVSLPAEGTTSTAAIDRFTIGFTDEMTTADVTNAANFELRGSANGSFGDPDDTLYTVAPDPYPGGLTASYMISDGPLQPGHYRLTISTALKDRAGNHLASPYVRLFTVDALPGYVLEGRDNGTPARATPLGPRSGSDGSVAFDGYQGVGAQPYDIAKGDLNGDGKLDLVTADINSDQVTVLLGKGDGSFQAGVTYTTQSGPIGVTTGDLNHDGKPDVVAVNYYSSSASIFLNNGDGTFAAATNVVVGANPRNVRLADLDGDEYPEILIGDAGASSITILKRTAGDPMYARTDKTTGIGAWAVAVGDLNGDSKLDVVVANGNVDTVSVLLGDGTGALAAAVNYPVGDLPRDVAIADLDGDGKADIVTLNANSRDLSVLKGDGSGTFPAPVSYGGLGSDPYHLALGDLNGDGKLDVVVATHGNSYLDRLFNQGDGTFGSVSRYFAQYSSIGVVTGDWNGDGRLDVATANYNANRVTVWLGIPALTALTEDPAGVFTGVGRGNLSSRADRDYYSFTAQAGDILSIVAENPGSPGSSQLYYEIHRADDGSGGSFSSFYTDGSGRGQSDRLTLPVGGTYNVMVSYSNDYFSEYRLRVTLVRGGTQMEDENGNNNSIANADFPTLTLAAGKQVGSVHGYIGQADGSGDYYGLGNLTAGTAITLGLRKPATSPLVAILGVYKGDGTLVAEGAAGATTLAYTIAPGGDAAYYARVRSSSGEGFLSQYLLDLQLEDTVPPTITAVDFPAEGTTTNAILDRFTVSFSEDLMASTATNAANFELISSQNNTFGDGDDSVYQVVPAGYSAGLSAVYLVGDGPLQPGKYRLTIATGLKDRAGLSLVSPYVRTFTVEAVPGYVLEDRDNDSPWTATPLGPQSGSDGSFRSVGTFAAGTTPYDITQADFNGDGKLDLAIANYSSGNVSVLLGNGDGTFQAAVNYPTQSGPIGITAGDLNNDGKADLVVANYNSASVSLLLNNGDGTFAAALNVSVGSNPRALRLGNLDADAFPEIIVGNISSSFVTVLHRQPLDPTYDRTDAPTASTTWGIAVGDLNGDGKLDVVATSHNVDTISVFLGNGTGGLAAAVSYPVGDYPRDVAIGDLDGDGKADLVTLNANSRTLSVLKGDGSGTFPAPVTYSGIGSDPYHLALADLNADGKLDVAVAVYGNSYIDQFFNKGDGTFGSVVRYSVGSNPIAIVAGDWNGDGRTDLATANYGGNNVGVWLGNPTTTLSEDPTGIFTAIARGRLSGRPDYDYYSFTAVAGDLLTVAVEAPGSPGSSQVYYRINNPDGSYLSDFYSDGNGRGQSDRVAIPATGTYTVYVRYYQDYFSEYRLRVTLARGGVQMEDDYNGNNSIGAADLPTLTLAAGKRTATVHGYVGLADGSGDYFGLGNLTAGTAITLGLRLPAGSPLVGILGIYKADGTLLAEGAPGAASLAYTVASGGDAAHFARVRASSGASFLAQYLLDIELADTVPPTITSVDLPAEGTTSSAILDRFTVGFSEDMLASTVTNVANLELRSSQNDTFGDEDDVVYTVVPSGYAAGLSELYYVGNGPLQPGKYRLTLGTGLKDRTELALAGAYVRTFTVQGVAGYVLENRDNGTPWTATPLGPRSGSDGSFRFGADYVVGNQPYDIAKGDFNGDGKLDLAVPCYGSAYVSVLFGNGNGTFQTAVNYPTQSGPIGVAAGDLNNDGKADLVVVNYNSNSASILLNNGDGTFAAAVNVGVGSNPRNVRLGSLDGDAYPEIIVGNGSSSFLTVLQRQPANATYVRTDRGTGSQTWGVAVGDLNADGKLDVVAANAASDNVSVLLGDGTGTLATAVNYPAGDQPRDISVGDLDGDGKPDLVVLNATSRTLSVLKGAGDGTFLPAVTYSGIGSDPYHLLLADLNGDGKLDVAVSVYGNSYIDQFFNQGDGTLGGLVRYSVSNNPISLVAGDWNGDSVVDLASASYGGDRVTVWLGNPITGLTESPAGFFTATARGNVSDGSDRDYYAFSAKAGDQLTVAVEVPGNPSSSQLYYRIDRPDGSIVTDFYSGGNGYGQSTPVTLPADGTYTVSVRFSNSYTGEYRLRVTLARGGIQLESEGNDGFAQADPVSLALDGGQRKGTIAGYFGVGEALSGDYFSLGNLAAGTTINVGTRTPASSHVAAAVTVYDPSHAEVAASTEAGSPASHTVQSGANGTYFVRVLPVPPRRGALRPNLEFTGNVHVNVPIDIPENTMTVSFWFFSLSSSAGLFEAALGNLGSSGNDRHLYLSGGNIYARLYSNQTISSTGKNYGDGRWHHVAYQFGADLGGQRIYVDGVLVASGDKTSSDFTTQDRIVIGYSADLGYLTGAIEDVSLWNVALSETDITGLMNASPAGNESGLIGYWRLNEGTGTTATDASGNGHPGTIVNGTPWFTFGPTGTELTGLLMQYLLDVTLGDSVAPQITSVSLPAAASTTQAVIDRFSLGFSEDMLPATVVDPGSYDLRAAGPNGDFGDDDDVVYAVSCTGYTSGLTADFVVSDGPLQAGTYRYTVKTSVQDLSANPIASPYVREFTVQSPAGFVLEDRSNNGMTGGTSLSPSPSPVFDGSFFAGNPVGTGNSPYNLASADLNGDGNADLVVANYGAASVSVLIGNGDGTFRTQVTYGTGGQPVDILIADLTGDGKLDVATANYSGGSVTILPGVGDGTFGSAITLSSPNNPNGLAVGDFNQDGKLDLVVARRGGAGVHLFLGHADGTFDAAVAIPAGAGSARVAAGDVNGDGKADLVVANFNAASVSVLLGDGTGGFGTATNFPTANNPYWVSIADVSEDGVPDLVVANYGSASFSVLLGTGGGAFATKVDTASGGSNPYALKVSDLDGDGHLDVLIPSYGSGLGVFYGMGGGAFRPIVSYPTGSGPVGVAVGDWNKDGRIDLATANQNTDNVSLFFGNSSQPLGLETAGHGIRTASGYGNLFDGSDADYWLFSAQAGDRVVLGAEVPGRPGGSSLRYRVYGANGTLFLDFYSNNQGWGQSGVATLPANGTYSVLVTPNNTYTGEYRIRVLLAPADVAQEGEDNGGVGSASPMTLVTNGSSKVGTAVGYIRTSGDLDYFNLGAIDAGMTVFLNARLLDYATVSPVVSVYNASNGYVNEAPGGRAFDAVGEVRITTPGTYYAVVRGGPAEGGLREGYVLEAQIVPTASVAFPNLQVTSLLPPSGAGLKSGDPVNVSFTVKNVGALGTGGASWADRLVLSPNTTLGDLDDVQLAVFPHSGALDPLGEYTVAQTVNLPDGIEGDYYLIAQTDSGNAIAEFVLEADNTTVSDTTFHVSRATYPDLKPENVAGVVSGAEVALSWTTANRGAGASPAGGFKDAVAIRNTQSGTVEFRAERTVGSSLAVDATLAGSATAPLPPPGHYAVDVTVDSGLVVYEFDANSHASAEDNNLASSSFDVFSDLTVVNVRVEPAGDLISGGFYTVKWDDTVTGHRGTSGSWVDRLVVVNRTTGQTLLNTTVTHDSGSLGNLNPGESHVRQASFTLPGGSAGTGTIEFTVTVDSGAAITEFNGAGTAESNNSTVLTKTAVLAPYPDLTVTAFALPATSDAGQAIELHWTVTNTGTVPASGSWVDALYLSTNSSGANPVAIGTSAFSGTIAAGASLERVASFMVPAGSAPTQYVVATVDSANQLTEMSDQNNSAVSATSFHVRRPNLIVKNVSMPPSADAGQTITVQWDVQNTGDGSTFGNWNDAISRASTASPGVLEVLGQLQHTNAIAAGATETMSVTLTFPGGPRGDYRITVAADSGTNIPESDETDNSAQSAGIIVLRSPDLQVVNSSVPSSAAFGATITVNYSLRNDGNSEAAGLWSDRIYLSTDNLRGGDTVLLTRPIGGASPIAGGAVVPLTAEVTLPVTGTPGTYYLFVQADADNDVGEDLENNNFSPPLPITLTVPPRPDLVTENIQVPVGATPGGTVSVTWTVRNSGAEAVNATWKDSVYLSTDAAIGGDVHLGTFAFTDTLAAGASTTRTRDVVIPATAPAGTLRIVVVTDTGSDVPEASELNNGGISAGTFTLPLVLTLTPASGSVAEGANLALTIARTGDRSSPLTVGLASSDTSELTVPASVVIAAGQGSATFNAHGATDGVADGNQSATVTATAVGFANATGTYQVTDAQIPQLVIRPSGPSSTVGEGATLAMVVEMPFAMPGNLVVTIASASPTQLVPPAPVTIVGGQTSAAFAVAAVDDTLVEGTKTYRLTASASGVDAGTVDITVTDNDVPSVSLALNTATLSESAGAAGIQGTLVRSFSSDRDLVVRLDVSAPGLTLPAQVTIPAGTDAANFWIGAANNNAVDGTRIVNIQGAVLSSSGLGVLGTTAAVPVTILDDDGPTLTLTFDRGLVHEGQNPGPVCTVSRNGSTTEALVVLLSSSDTSELTVPDQVTIPAGEVSTTFSAVALDDGTSDGNQVVTVAATAQNYGLSTTTITVTDFDVPDLVVTKTEGPATAITEAYVPVTFRIVNQGNESTTTNFSTRVFLSPDPVIGEDTLMGNYVFKGAIPPGLYFEQNVSIRMPGVPGKYYVITSTDVGNQVAEALENNNTLVSVDPIVVQPAYTATVQTPVDSALAGADVPMSGSAVRPDGSPAQEGSLVNIHIYVNGTHRTISALCDRSGNFSTTWHPLFTEAGAYDIGAAHPGEKDAPVQDHFVLLGMKIEPPLTVFHVAEGATYNGSLRVLNLSPQPLTGLQVQILGQPSNVGMSVSVADTTLPGNGETTLNFSVTANSIDFLAGSALLYVSSTEGSWAGAYLGIAIDPLRPHLVATPSPLVASMLRGSTRVVECTVTNDGGYPSDPLTVSPAPLPWLKVSSQNPIPSLAPGESAKVTFVLTPPADIALGPQQGNINIGNSSTWVNVPFNFRAVSDSRGDLRVTVVDEFTYYAEGSPKVADADVVVRDPFTQDVLAQGKTDADGVFLAPNLLEGYYTVEINAAKHTSYRNNTLVTPGTVNDLLAFISRETVRYTWKVEPIEIEDHYKITIETEFETVVPVPVITVEPAVIDLGAITAEETQVDLKITNHGLIQAENFQLHFPTHPSWEFTPLVSDLGFLSAKSSIIVPLTIKKLAGSGPSLAGGRSNRAALQSGGACHTAASATWEIQCGPFNPSYSATISMPNAASGCGGGGGGSGSYPVSPGGGFGGAGGRGGGGGGGGGGFSGPSVGGGAPCSPPASQNSIAKVAALQSTKLHAGSEGICARIKMRLEQEAVITRDAFQASLEIDNGDTADLTEVAVSVRALNAAGQDVSDLFGIHPPTISGLGAVDGTGTVAAGATGSARWLIVPTVDAAPKEPTVFFVAGEFSYVLSGTRVRVPLDPVRITVLPTPRLWVKYFHQRDVYSDDPFTDEIEPSIPFTLAVMVENRGYGSTKHMKITSAQPQIIENNKGLLIDFKIIAAQVAGQNLVPSLTVDFGDIGPSESVVGWWLMTSTLQGLFINYKASFEHVDGLGNPRLSLIEDLSIHELIHMVYADGPFADFKPDFFVNEVPDELDLGDTIYLSNGQTNPVERVDFANVIGSLGGGSTSVDVTALMPAAWGYLRIPDPGGAGHTLKRVVRSDGTEIPVGVNVWTTDRTFIGQSKRPIRENILHLLDYASTGAYRLYYDEAPAGDAVPPTSQVNVLPATSPANFPVTWQGADNAGGKGVAFYDVYVSTDGGAPVLWLNRTDIAGSMYTGEPGHTYSFFTRATDLDGNREAAPAVADATTQVGFLSTAPVVGPIDAQTTAEDTPIVGLPFTVTDPDTAPADLKFTIETSNSTLLPADRVTVNRPPGGFSLSLNPVADRSGTVDVTVIAADSTDTGRQTFTLTVTPVNDPPVAGLDTLKRRIGGSAKVPISQLLANDSDPESDPISLFDVTSPSPGGATVVRSGDWIVYTPPPGGGASFDWFIYTLTDGRGGFAYGTVVVSTDEPDQSPSRNVLDIHLEGDSAVIEFVGIPGRSYLVQATSSLSSPNWVTLGTVSADRFGVIKFVEDHPPGGTRYYRTFETGN